MIVKNYAQIAMPSSKRPYISLENKTIFIYSLCSKFLHERLNNQFSDNRMKNNQFSEIITVFQGRTAPEEGFSVGYGALLKQIVPPSLNIFRQDGRTYLP
jgi:hypothetical protein